MKKVTFVLLAVLICAGGCESLRFAPGQAQKQNAWLHNRTTAIAAQRARGEQSSQQLQQLIDLSEKQSRAFVSYFGQPSEFAAADTAEQILSEANYRLADEAVQQAADRPDGWELADNAMELGIAVAGLFGGVYGVRAARFIKDTRSKTRALQEIVSGNEKFKTEHRAYAGAFKDCQRDQSNTTRQIVAELKADAG